MAECNYPRAMADIIKEMVLFSEDTFWLKSRFLRRGRLLDAACCIIADRKTIEPDWFKGHSGETEDDRVEHSEILPELEAMRAFMDEHRFVLKNSQMVVVNEIER